MNVSAFMSKVAVTVTPNTPLPQVWKIIFNKHIHGLPVIDKNKKLLGIISEEDLLNKLFPGYDELGSGDTLPLTDEDLVSEKLAKLKKWSAEKVMNRRVIYTREDTNIMRALSRMLSHKVRQLPVLNDEDQIVGIISKADVFRGLFKK